jgi:PKD repeat protein
MKNTLIATLICLVQITVLSAQSTSKNYTVRFQHGIEQFPENFSTAAATAPTQEEIIQHRFVRWVQFESVLTATDRQFLADAGLEMIGYVHFGAYLLSVPEDYNLQRLSPLLPRSIVAPQGHWKMHRNLTQRPLGEWAVKGELVQVELQVMPFVSIEAGAAYCTTQGWTVVKKGQSNGYLQVLLPQDALHTLAEWPGTLWMELLSKPGEKEDINGRSMHRANLMDSDHPLGKKYNGEGIAALVRDDGEVGPHIDFKGRLFNQEDVNSSFGGTHGDGVAGIIGAAGNLDPTKKGMAAGADIYVLNYESDFEDPTIWLHLNKNVTVTNSSYSDGCNAGYTFATKNVDDQIFAYPTLMHVFSAGNSNGVDCDYGAGNQWGNITGGHKMAKNAIATANLRVDGTLETTSSRGPAHDGRIKPDIAAHGTDHNSTDPNNEYQEFGGTSAAAPGIAGCMAQLMHAYKTLNNGEEAPTALLKLAMLVTANDMGNAGPDFKFGWGHINNYRALGVLEQNRYSIANVDQNGTNQFTIDIPAGVAEARLMLYWADPSALESAGKALVNDLDLTVTGPGNTILLPLVLDPTPNVTALNALAVPGPDNLNNMEQVRLANPISGTYTFNITGYEVPFGPQQYYLAWEFITAAPQVIFPAGGESLATGTSEWIHWDAHGNNGTFQLQFSANNGTTWNTISGANALTDATRSFKWNIPNVVTKNAKIRVVRNGIEAVSTFPFSIAPVPQNLGIDRVCPDSITIGWTALSDTSMNYDVLILGEKYMELKGTSTTDQFAFPITDATQSIWAAVRASREDSLIGRRSLAVNWPGGLKNCPQDNDAALNGWLNPVENTLVSCGATNFPLSMLVTNDGLNAMTNASAYYQINNGAVVSESLPVIAPGESLNFTFTQLIQLTQNEVITLSSWVAQPNENYSLNDTLSRQITVVTDLVSTYFTETFEGEALALGWVIGNPDGEITWERSSTVIGANDSPTRAMYLNHYSYGAEGELDHLYLAPVDLLAITDPGLKFDYSHAQFTNYFDSLRIEAFPGCDLSADPILLWEKGDPEYATVAGINGPFEPVTGNDWETAFIDLASIAGDKAIIRFTSINGYGNSAFLDNIGVQAYVNSAPVAEFSAPDTICRTESIVFQAAPNVIGTYNWTFGSLSQPTSAEGPGPHTVTFPIAGSKIIRLIVTNPFGADTMTHVLRILGQPIANFGFTQNGNLINFNNTSNNAASFTWNFGDGNTSTLANPSHEYANAGTYIVTLSASNQCGSSEKNTTINYTTATIEATGFKRVDVLPNPNNGQFQVVLEHPFSQLNAEFNLYDIAGRRLHHRPAQLYNSGVHILNYDNLNLSAGQYQLQISTEKGSASLTVLVQ